MRMRDFIRVWVQLVKRVGINKYSSTEWQKHYTDFWNSMQSTGPFIRIDCEESLMKIASSCLGSNRKSFSNTKEDELEPNSPSRKRIKLDIVIKEQMLSPNESPSDATTSKNSKNKNKRAKETITKITTLNLDRTSQKQERPENKKYMKTERTLIKQPNEIDSRQNTAKKPNNKRNPSKKPNNVVQLKLELDLKEEPIIEKRTTRSQMKVKSPAKTAKQTKQLNTKIKRNNFRVKSMKIANKELAHKPPSPLDLTCVARGAPSAPAADDDDDGIVCLSSQSKLIPTVEQAKNLSLPKKGITGDEQNTDDFINASHGFDELIDVTSSISPNTKSDYELQDICIEDSIRLPDPLPSCLDISLLLADDIVDVLTDDIPGLDEIERCLASFSGNTLTEIEHKSPNCINNLASLSPTVKDKTPLEEDTLADKMLNYEFDDDNDDIDAISVDTSWNGEDDFESDLNCTTKVPMVLQQESPATPAAPKASSTELIKFCISKKVIEASVSQGAMEPQQPKAPSAQSQLLPHRQMLQQQQQQQKKQITNSNSRWNGSQSIPAGKPVPPVPIFAPPFRLPPGPAAVFNAIPSSIPNIYASGDNKPTIFGIKCWRYLDGRCQQRNCNHLLYNIDNVQRCLNQLPPDKVRDNYGLLLRHGILFKTYFLLFAETFGKRGMLPHLIEMVKDCGLYLAFSVPFLTDLYQILVRCGLTPEAAASHFMNHLWQPHNAATHPALFEQLLRILATANWIMYSEHLEHLFKSGFPVPVAFFDSILKEAIHKRDTVLAEKVQQIAGMIMQSTSSEQHAPPFPPIVMISDNRF